jgi:hypothetical protein
MSQNEPINPFSKQRIANIKQLQEEIKKSPNLPVEQILASFSIETGSSPKRVREYFQTLVASKKVKLCPKGLVDYAVVEEA